MGIQTTLGKAFEYACLQSLYKSLIDNQQIVIEQTSAYLVAKDFYDNAETSMKQKMDLGATAAVKVILRLEPQLQNPLKNTPLYLTIQEDSSGISGDVRDVLCIRNQNDWQIGLSCKHNHSAVKHSRLSSSIDFGKLWFDIPCSINYFNTINPLFDELKKMKADKILWKDVKDKDKRFYIPLLQAFITELKALDSSNPSLIPERLLHYLLGRNDFYKVITSDSKKITKVQAFNIYGTLNRYSGSVRPQTRIQQLNMPTKFFDIDFKQNSTNTINITCDGGWAISMRIHNASSKVEPSLKFDVGLIGIPQTLYTHFESWT
jgi:hypothetical protein